MAILAAFGVLSSSNAEPGFAYVPASPEIRSLGAVEAPYDPSESDVILVGTMPSELVSGTGPHWVFSVDIGLTAYESGGTVPSAEIAISAIPKGALWPDASGRVTAAAHGTESGERSGGNSNPWEPRNRPKHAACDTRFQCGGVIIGGDGGPIAFVNGRTVRRGDYLGNFCVACVAREGAVVELGGFLYVLPLGRATTVTTVDQ